MRVEVVEVVRGLDLGYPLGSSWDSGSQVGETGDKRGKGE